MQRGKPDTVAIHGPEELSGFMRHKLALFFQKVPFKETRVDISMPFIPSSSYLLPVLRSHAVGIEFWSPWQSFFLGMCTSQRYTVIPLCNM